MNKTTCILLLLLAAIPLAAGNSGFSYAGYPVNYFGKDIYSLGMGDTGASDVFRNNTGYGNPAQHNINNRSLFSTGILMGYNSYKSQDPQGQEYSYIDNSLDLPYFSLSVPLQNHRVGFQLNSYASGVVANQRESETPDGTEFTEKREMDRYIYRADLIYSLHLGRHSLGISGNYYFGHETQMLSQDAGYGLFSTREELKRSFKNPSFSLGYLMRLEKLAWGVHYGMGLTLDGEEVRTSIHETEDPVDYEYKLPHQFSASVTALPAPEFKVATDFHYSLDSQIDPDSLRDSWKLGLGVAYEPDSEKRQNAFFRLPLRAGISYRMLPFSVEDAAVDELAFSLGLTLPLKGDVNRIDLGFQIVNRGSLEQNKLVDNSFLLMCGFTGFDIFSKAPDRRAPRDIPVKEDIGTW